MLTTTRRGISYPNPDRSDAPDIPLHLRNIALAADVDVFYDHGTAAARPAAGSRGRIYQSDDTGALEFDNGTGWISIIGGSTAGTYAARPAATAVAAGSFYYATDKDVLYRSTGAAWTRIGAQAGDLTFSMDTVARAGTVALQGQTISRTGLNDELFAKWGTQFAVGGEPIDQFRLPDARGRGLIALGTNASVNTIGQSDGIVVANRRGTKHRHTPHHHPFTARDIAQTDSIASGSFTGAADINNNYNTGDVDGGSGVATDPLDGGAFLVVNVFAKL